MNPVRSYLARAFLATEFTDGDGRVELTHVTRVFRLGLELCLAGGARQGHLNTVHYRKNDNLEYTVRYHTVQRENESRQLKEKKGKKSEKYIGAVPSFKILEYLQES
jgi:hypothetical protein